MVELGGNVNEKERHFWGAGVLNVLNGIFRWRGFEVFLGAGSTVVESVVEIAALRPFRTPVVS